MTYQPRIEYLIEDIHDEIRTLVMKLEAASTFGKSEKYIEYADAIVSKINEIKSLKRRLKFYNFIEKIKGAIK